MSIDEATEPGWSVDMGPVCELPIWIGAPDEAPEDDAAPDDAGPDDAGPEDEVSIWLDEVPDRGWVVEEGSFEDDGPQGDDDAFDDDALFEEDAPNPDDAICWGRGPAFDDEFIYTTSFGDGGASPEEIRTLGGSAFVTLERGGVEDDEMTGGRGGDDLRGRGGDDLMHGRGGADSLDGGAGADSLYGDNGRDRLEGGGGDDLLHGGRGRDRLYGGGGDDTLYADGGADRMFGGRGSDSFNFDLRDGSVVFIGDFVSGEDRFVCRGFDGPVTEDDFSVERVRDGLSNTLLFGEVVASFNTTNGEVPTFDDLLFA